MSSRDAEVEGSGTRHQCYAERKSGSGYIKPAGALYVVMGGGGVEVDKAEGSRREFGSGSRGQRVISFTLSHTCFELVGWIRGAHPCYVCYVPVTRRTQSRALTTGLSE